MQVVEVLNQWGWMYLPEWASALARHGCHGRADLARWRGTFGVTKS